ncbi:hypothetical protein PROFUN_07517 [Planoprotostelium fungivorum]|uniref:Uncharacterized protein n=1 Tax=Planoprotostelium fungivorum TaxID=1890364 RepID=A0A2P6NLN3_9EUKA|nr:hypothetical protein PROFUN_07517 [Planoprotostelium fungivorum]
MPPPAISSQAFSSPQELPSNSSPTISVESNFGWPFEMQSSPWWPQPLVYQSDELPALFEKMKELYQSRGWMGEREASMFIKAAGETVFHRLSRLNISEMRSAIQKQRTVVSASPIPCILVDASGKPVFANDAFYELTSSPYLVEELDIVSYTSMFDVPDLSSFAYLAFSVERVQKIPAFFQIHQKKDYCTQERHGMTFVEGVLWSHKEMNEERIPYCAAVYLLVSPHSHAAVSRVSNHLDPCVERMIEDMRSDKDLDRHERHKYRKYLLNDEHPWCLLPHRYHHNELPILRNEPDVPGLGRRDEDVQMMNMLAATRVSKAKVTTLPKQQLLNSGKDGVNSARIARSSIEATDTSWIPDGAVSHCPLCELPFGLLRRKHHCRRCGGIFCAKCSTSRIFLQLEQVRVCDACTLHLHGEEENASVELYTDEGDRTNTKWSFDHLGDGNIRDWFAVIHQSHSDQHYTQHHSDSSRLLNKKLFCGISTALRPVLWPQLAESSEIHKKNAGVYKEILDMMPGACKYVDQINADVPRTFPSHPFFRDQKGQDQLRNILMAFSVLKGDIGYCQGLNYLAGVILLHMEEEKTLWMLMQLMKKYEYGGFYVEGAPALDTCMKIIDKTMKNHMPDLWNHFDKHGFPFQIFASQWLKTIFSYNFPMDLVFRIWDVFLAEKLNFLLWVTFMILDNSQEELLTMSDTQLMSFFNRLPDRAFISLRASLESQT